MQKFVLEEYALMLSIQGRNLVKKLLKQEFRNSKNELQLDDPFNMNVMFYDGETPINNFKSKKEFIDKEIRLEICKIIYQHSNYKATK